MIKIKKTHTGYSIKRYTPIHTLNRNNRFL